MSSQLIDPTKIKLISPDDPYKWIEWGIPLMLTLLIAIVGISYQLFIQREKKRNQFKDDLNLFTKSVNKLITDPLNKGDTHKKIERIWNSVIQITPIVKKINDNEYTSYYFIKGDHRNKYVSSMLKKYVEKLEFLGDRSANNASYEKLNQDFSICLAKIIKGSGNRDFFEKILEEFDVSVRGQRDR